MCAFSGPICTCEDSFRRSLVLAASSIHPTSALQLCPGTSSLWIPSAHTGWEIIAFKMTFQLLKDAPQMHLRAVYDALGPEAKVGVS